MHIVLLLLCIFAVIAVFAESRYKISRLLPSGAFSRFLVEFFGSIAIWILIMFLASLFPDSWKGKGVYIDSSSECYDNKGAYGCNE